MIEILLVEDDDGDIFMMQEALESAHFETKLHITHNGEEALKYLNDSNNAKPDFIISDINMPRMNGHEFLAEVAKNASLKKIPVVVLTNSGDIEDFIKSYELNATASLSKPLTQGKINDMVRSIERFWSKAQ